MPPATPTRQAATPWAAYAALALAWLATRMVAVISVDMTPWMLNDIDIYRAWAPGLLDGRFPDLDPAWQYPPGIAPVLVAAGSLGVDYRWGFTLVILAVDAALMAALLWAHARASTRASWLGPGLWASAGVVVGPIMVVRFDVVPTLFAVLAVLLLSRPARSGVLAAVGALTKAWPLLMLLVLPRRALPRAAVAAAVTVTVGLAVFAMTTDGALSFLSHQQDRGLQVESVGALPFELWTLAGGEVRFDLSYGSIQVLMDGAETVGLVVTLAGLVLLGLIAWWRLRGRLEQAPPGDVALAVVLVSLAGSRVYSPQFNVWVIGIASAALLDPRCRIRTVAALTVVLSLLTQVVYPWSATQLVTADAFTITVQAVRIAVLLLAMILALVGIRRIDRNLPPAAAQP